MNEATTGPRASQPLGGLPRLTTALSTWPLAPDSAAQALLHVHQSLAHGTLPPPQVVTSALDCPQAVWEICSRPAQQLPLAFEALTAGQTPTIEIGTVLLRMFAGGSLPKNKSGLAPLLVWMWWRLEQLPFHEAMLSPRLANLLRTDSDTPASVLGAYSCSLMDSDPAIATRNSSKSTTLVWLDRLRTQESEDGISRLELLAASHAVELIDRIWAPTSSWYFRTKVAEILPTLKTQARWSEYVCAQDYSPSSIELQQLLLSAPLSWVPILWGAWVASAMPEAVAFLTRLPTERVGVLGLTRSDVKRLLLSSDARVRLGALAAFPYVDLAPERPPMLAPALVPQEPEPLTDCTASHPGLAIWLRSCDPGVDTVRYLSPHGVSVRLWSPAISLFRSLGMVPRVP